MTEIHRASLSIIFAITLVASAALVPSVSFQQQQQQQRQGDNDMVLKMDLIPSRVEAGKAVYPIGYVHLETSEGMPVLAPYDITVDLRSLNSTVASVPPSIILKQESDYAKFDVSVNVDSEGETEISALLGNQIVSKEFKVVQAVGLIPQDIKLVINMPSGEMQLGAEMPISVYLQSEDSILQAPKDIKVSFEYETSLISLSSSSITIEKGSYYALATVRALEKTGNAFIKASTTEPLLNTVQNIVISSSRPASLQVHVFPEKVSLKEKTIDLFVNVVDSSGNPTLASDDINLELFSSSAKLSDLKNVKAVIKKGEFGYHLRESIFFTDEQEGIIVGASSSGLGAATDTFDVVKRPLDITDDRAEDRVVTVYTIPQAPSASSSIMVYQLNAVETDEDDADFNHDGDFTNDGDDVDEDGLFDDFRDHNKDGLIDENDFHPIDDLADGELYPIQGNIIYSSSQGNINVVSGDNDIAKIVDSGEIGAGASYGTAIVSAGKLGGSVGVSVSIQDVGSGTGTMTITGGLSPTQTKIFSPVGTDPEGNGRLVFDEHGQSDLFFITMDSTGRPSGSEGGARYLVKPVNDIVQVAPGKSFAGMVVDADSFGTDIQEGTTTVNAIPIGVDPNPNLQSTTDFDLISFTGTTATVTFPMASIFGFSRASTIGTVQLNNQFGSPVLATTDAVVSLSSSVPNTIQVPQSVTIKQGDSFAQFPITMAGKGGNVTISVSSDGVRSSSADMEVVLADMNSSRFVDSGDKADTAKISGNLTVVAPQGADVLWGVPSSFEVVSKDDKAFRYNPTTGEYFANLQVIPSKEGDYTVDVTLLKDGYQPKRLSTAVAIEPFLLPMSVSLTYADTAIPYGKPVVMNVHAEDRQGNPIERALVIVNPGLNATADPLNVYTDDSGNASFSYTVTDTHNLKKIVQVTVGKDGYSDGTAAREFDIKDVPTNLPPWVTYVLIAAVLGSVGGGVAYFMKKPKGKRFDEEVEEEEEEI